MMAHIFDSQSDAFYTSGHMMDDGMIDPRNMRSTLRDAARKPCAKARHRKLSVLTALVLPGSSGQWRYLYVE